MSKKVFVSLMLLAIVAASFFCGKYAAQAEMSNNRKERCITQIVFAIDKAENGDLADRGVLRALISNVYAACQLCDHSVVANQLHDLWNFLIFESDSNPESAKEIALIELNDALRAIKATE